MLDHGHQKRIFRNNQKVTFQVWRWTLWTFIHITFKIGIFTQIWKNWWGNLWKFTKCVLYATKVFCWGKFRHLGYENPRSSASLIQKCGEKLIIHLQRFEMVFQEKGQDHIIMKGWTMELLRRLLFMKRHQTLRNVSEQISMPNSTYVWRLDVNSS